MAAIPEMGESPEPAFENRVTMEGSLVLPALHAIGMDLIADAMGRDDDSAEFGVFLTNLQRADLDFTNAAAVQDFAGILHWWQEYTPQAIQQIMYDFPEQIAMPLIQERQYYGEVAGMIGDQLDFQVDFQVGMADLEAVDSVARELQNPEQWLQP